MSLRTTCGLDDAPLHEHAADCYKPRPALDVLRLARAMTVLRVPDARDLHHARQVVEKYARLAQPDLSPIEPEAAAAAKAEPLDVWREPAVLLASAVRRYFEGEAKAVVSIQPLVERIERLAIAQPERQEGADR